MTCSHELLSFFASNIIMCPYDEEWFTRNLRDLPITAAPATVDPGMGAQVSQALARVDVKTKVGPDRY